VTNLNHETCYRIIASRDARYDGRLFVGVKTTGVYCRPICRVRMPKPASCVFFSSAIAAQSAGFRSCLRCRPEIAPSLAAWNGTSTTVERALGLIAGGALDDERLDRLATRVGIGERHLRRLFIEHLGTTPIAVVQTRRVLFAKRLITETPMSMAHVAMAAGFGSVRRFNETMRKVYGRTPTALRSARDVKNDEDQDDVITLALPYSGNYDWPHMAAWLRSRAIAGVETVGSDGTYIRSIAFQGAVGIFEVHPPAGEAAQLLATIRFPKISALLTIVDRIKRIFDLDADLDVINTHLASDPRLAPLIARRPRLRVPGAWDGYELTIRAILGQQISVVAAWKLAARLVERFGTPLPDGSCSDRHAVRLCFPQPAILADADIASFGMPRARADAIRAAARAAVDDPHYFEPSHDLAGSIARLRRLTGIGEWTAQYIALRAMREPDAFPSGDIGLMRAFVDERGLRPTSGELLQAAQAWRPWRAYAALHLWASESERTSEAERTSEREHTAVGSVA